MYVVMRCTNKRSLAIIYLSECMNKIRWFMSLPKGYVLFKRRVAREKKLTEIEELGLPEIAARVDLEM